MTCQNPFHTFVRSPAVRAPQTQNPPHASLAQARAPDILWTEPETAGPETAE